MKQITSIILSALMLSSCIFNNTINKRRNFEMDCTNNFNITFSENSTVKNGDTVNEISVLIKGHGEPCKYLLKQAISASGVRYITDDEKYVLWEHQGTFTWSNKDSLICECNPE